MPKVNLTTEINKTISFYKDRVNLCTTLLNTLPQQVADQKEKIEKMKVPELKQFIKAKNDRIKISGMKRDELQATAIDQLPSWKIRHAQTQIPDYKEHIAYLEQLKNDGIIAKFNDAIAKINKSEVVAFPVYNYDTLPVSWGYPFDQAQQMAKAIRSHEGEVCVLTGGGKLMSDPDSLYYVQRVTNHGKEGSNGISVQVAGHELTQELTQFHDNCGKYVSREDQPSFDVKNMAKADDDGYRIQSWQVYCFKEKK